MSRFIRHNYLPGRPRGYPLGLPQIRTCPIKASGSSRQGFTFALRYPWALREPGTGIQSPRRVAHPRFPDGHPPSLPRVPAVQVPLLRRYYEDVRLPASLSPRFVAFAWRYQALRLSFRSQRSRTPNRGPGVRNPVPTAGRRRLETIRASQGSWRTRVCLCPVLRPRRTCVPGQLQYADTAPAHRTTKALTRGNFGAQSHGLDTGCLRFVQWVTRTGRKTRFRLLASSTGWDWIPTGFLRKVSDHSSPFPRLSWRKRCPLLLSRGFISAE